MNNSYDKIRPTLSRRLRGFRKQVAEMSVSEFKFFWDVGGPRICDEAATEIDRLNSEVSRLKEVIRYSRTSNDCGDGCSGCWQCWDVGDEVTILKQGLQDVEDSRDHHDALVIANGCLYAVSVKQEIQ